MNPLADCAAAKSHDSGCSRRSSDAIAATPVDEEVAQRQRVSVREPTERYRRVLSTGRMHDQRRKLKASLQWTLQHVGVLDAGLRDGCH